MSLTSTGTPTSLSTSALWISNQRMTRSFGVSSGACCNAWGCMATCWVLCSPCMMALCCQCGLVVSVAPARVHPSASDLAAHSVPRSLASSITVCIQYLQTAAPAAELQTRHLWLTDLIYPDDVCLMASSPEHPQAIIDALAVYFATLGIETNVAGTKVMVVSKPSKRPLSLHAVAWQWSMLTVSNTWASFSNIWRHFPSHTLLL